MSDKKYSPKEAALAVLAKAQELYKLSALSKSYEGFKAVEASAAKSGASDPAAVAAAAGRKKYGKEAFQHAAAAGKKMGKSDANPDEKQDAELGENVEAIVGNHEKANEGAESQEPEMKGHIKLAKFVGRMEHKKGQKSKEMDKAEMGSQMSGKSGTLATKETGHEKGVAVKGNHGASQGISEQGAALRNASYTSPKAVTGAVSNAKTASVGRMMENEKIKPKLPG